MARGLKAALALAGLALLVAVAAANVPVGEWLASSGAALIGSGPSGIGLFCGLFVAGVMLSVPAWTFSLAAGLLFGPWGILVAWSCMMVAAALTLPLVRRVLAGPVQAMIARRPRLRLIADAIDDEGWRMVLLVRLSGIVPFGMQNGLLGLTRIGLGVSLAATAIGILPGVLLHAGLGALSQTVLGGYDATVLKGAVLLLGVLAALTLIVLTTRRLRDRLRRG